MGKEWQHKAKVEATSGKGAVPAEREFSPLVREGLIFVFFALVAFLIYSNVLHGPFVFDDEPNISENFYIRLHEYTLGGLEDAGFKGPNPHRPVANISFALNYYVHQYNTTGYHVVNVLIHIITGILLYVFILDTLGIWRKRVSGAWAMDEAHIPLIAFSAALLWLVHPIQTQAVSYIVQRMASMSSMFYLASFVLFVKGRLAGEDRARYLLYAGSAVCGVLAVGSKENAVTLPFFILLYDWYFFQDLSRAWLKRGLIFLSAALVVFVLLGLFYMGGSPWQFIEGWYAVRNFTLVERLLTEFRVVVLYISLLVFPYPGRLNLDYDFPVSHSLMDPVTTVFSIGIIVALAGLAIYLAKGQRVFSFCIVWFLGNLVIESSVFGLELVYEHRNYLPSMLVFLLAVLLVYRYVYARRQWVAVGLLVVLAVVFSGWTYERNKVWADDLVLWQDCVKKSPQKMRPHYNLGLALRKQGDVTDALVEFQKAVNIDPKYVPAYNNLGATFLDLGNIDEAIKKLSKAIQIDPSYGEAYSNLGLSLARQGKEDEAMKYFLKAVQLSPNNAKANSHLALALVKKANVDGAIEYYQRAVVIDPGLVEAHYGLGVALARKGDIEGAIREFQETLRIDPGNVRAMKNLGILLNRQ